MDDWSRGGGAEEEGVGDVGRKTGHVLAVWMVPLGLSTASEVGACLFLEATKPDRRWAIQPIVMVYMRCLV